MMKSHAREIAHHPGKGKANRTRRLRGNMTARFPRKNRWTKRAREPK
jgi:ribosomal protein L19E